MNAAKVIEFLNNGAYFDDAASVLFVKMRLIRSEGDKGVFVSWASYTAVKNRVNLVSVNGRTAIAA